MAPIKLAYGKALKNMESYLRWVAGTSVGALNGALVLMDDIEAAEQFGRISLVNRSSNTQKLLLKRNLIRYDGAIYAHS